MIGTCTRRSNRARTNWADRLTPDAGNIHGSRLQLPFLRNCRSNERGETSSSFPLKFPALAYYAIAIASTCPRDITIARVPHINQSIEAVLTGPTLDGATAVSGGTFDAYTSAGRAAQGTSRSLASFRESAMPHRLRPRMCWGGTASGHGAHCDSTDSEYDSAQQEIALGAEALVV